MSSTGVNVDNPLELIQKTYNFQGTTNNSDAPPPSHTKLSSHHPSRKTSVHDIHENTRDDFNKIIGEIHENLSRLRVLLETMTSAEKSRDDFNKLKEELFNKINQFISKLANESGKRGSIVSKGNGSNLTSYHPQHLVYCVEAFRSELVKAQYLFCSLILSSSIGSSTLESIIINSNIQNFKDFISINKDVVNLEEQAHLLNQRYYSQIPDWHALDDMSGGTLSNPNGSNLQRLRVIPLTQKMSTTSSRISLQNSSFCARLYQKCQMICCICAPKYI